LNSLDSNFNLSGGEPRPVASAEGSDEDNWELYALSRILDILTLRFQPNKNADGSEWPGPEISLNEYIEFIKILGLEIVYPEIYNAFYCEILEAKEGKNYFEINDYLFPGIKLKNLVIKRSGTIININPTDYDLDLINNARIFWTYRRKNREYDDLSHDWGTNSQWRTTFRLDIETDNSFIYNLQGEDDLNNLSDETLKELKEQNLTIDEAIELLVNRHFISCTKDSNDVYPYDFKYTENKNRGGA
jgi:hypothetical protein